MRFLRGRPSTTDSTALLWAKSLLNAALFFTVFMVALPWMAHRLLPAALPLPVSLQTWGGGILFVVGLAVWLVCLDAFSRRGRGTPLPTDAPRVLVTDGPFAVVRNPLIAAELMVLWGITLHFASAGILVYAILLTVAAHWVVVRIEEPELRKRFGERYEVYCRDVPRWIPGPGTGRPSPRSHAS
jgi:protein-S-isoprenylcysteine O-methyltransferase Ste14